MKTHKINKNMKRIKKYEYRGFTFEILENHRKDKFVQNIMNGGVVIDHSHDRAVNRVFFTFKFAVEQTKLFIDSQIK